MSLTYLDTYPLTQSPKPHGATDAEDTYVVRAVS